ncbi:MULTISPECIES: endo alpha-1,4 polygalactosaminidase [unclassified Amycolatopsis]|uniref:endo alpha-1,4 polygalactosaminidase n=1 Tax=unclassified Amycolatopsis TaxID=2618356 RepID=UPI002E0DC8AC|nr:MULTISPECIES: endo alpha-1,4 polygalactosaminidase [unclassified Amycolatopsis]WSJ79315.1 endo alpha-1,4 polygalactosaminidase [Amycolatopsis sp. NBC_01307]WSK77203.1 endo alpha-1,4 polygalactosaminidase [Amycolatopsis sp. NBC_01286]
MPTIIRSSMMPFSRVQFLASAALAAAVLGGTACTASAAPAAVTPPPVKAGFDYQIGGAYTPPSGVKVVSRDHTAAPAAGLYNICYVNAFQSQPGAEGEWGDLLLRDANGNVVVDEDWDEALLDLHTADKRTRVAAKVNAWVDDCAARGYQAIEPDNYDSFTRSRGLLSDSDAQAYIRLLSAHAHQKGLAIGQKNTSELAGQRQANGLDFAIAEECGQQKNCGEFTPAFGDHVIVIEYTDAGLKTACSRWSSLSIVRRDLDVVPKGESGYVRKTC